MPATSKSGRYRGSDSWLRSRGGCWGGHYRNGFIKQYVRDHLTLRTEAATNDVTDYGVRCK
jgi:hypothetical protein